MRVPNLNEVEGLGDVIAGITEFTGIKKVVNTIAKKTGKDCGCKKRQEMLNKRFPMLGKSKPQGETQ